MSHIAKLHDEKNSFGRRIALSQLLGIFGSFHLPLNSRQSTRKILNQEMDSTSDLAPVFPDPSYSQRNAASLTGERRAWAA